MHELYLLLKKADASLHIRGKGWLTIIGITASVLLLTVLILTD
jgi:hypothetical protein